MSDTNFTSGGESLRDAPKDYIAGEHNHESMWDFLERLVTRGRQADYFKNDIVTTYDFPQKDIIATDRVTKEALPLLTYFFSRVYIARVDPNTYISKHSHQEPILRIVMDGELEINGIKLVKGDWCYIKIGVEYDISTKPGYTAVAMYDCGQDKTPP